MAANAAANTAANTAATVAKVTLERCATAPACD